MGKLLIGWGRRDYSTDRPVNIPGQFHMRINKGPLDAVTANALVIDDGENSVIFCSCDIVVLLYHMLDLVREKVAKADASIPVMNIILNATHTHCGPDTGKWEPAFEYPMEVANSDETREFVTDKIAEAIVEAWQTRKPGKYAYGYGYAVVAHSRRVCYFDDVSKRPGAINNSTHGVNGTSVMYGNTNDDNFSSYEAGADHFVNLLYTFDEKDNLTGAIVNVPCPSQNSEHMWQLTADYWHDVRTAIRAKHGDINVISQCAAAGDLSPRILHYKAAQARRFALKYGVDPNAENRSTETELAARKDIAERVAAAFDEVLSWAQKDKRSEGTIKHVVETVELSRRLITDEEYEMNVKGYEAECKKPLVTEGTPEEILMANSGLMSLRNRHKQIIDRYELQKKQPKLPMELHVVGLDDIAFATNRFELYMDFQHRMQARSPFEQTFIIQLTGQPGVEGGTYLCTERGFKGRGYSASMYCNIVSPQGGQELVEETVKILKEIHK